ncbi:beta-galactosidase [Kibdelosporangium banguiense]|uniref:Beta-galactosidase n=1 Tax=Kibdelosporangium banguiense TaxID=1365924 RepID=A0ABS4TKG9_9PSEU|nr:beta-galactosidase [Kibdelosporangium banguiense]MBP2324919.1 beta-galactosidase [Kibdelosporangium banguiense]
MKSIGYGGDYNPEQWPREVWDQDYAAFELANINTLTVGVFAWAHLQPAEDRYDFTMLDATVERAAAEGKNIVLATPSGAMPPWLAHKYPEACRVDFEGRRHVYGQRHNACPSNPDFRRLAVELADKLAQRYGDIPAIVAWHVGNEYGGACYCPQCAAAFRDWLKKRYDGFDRLNAAWNTTFWSHTFTDWDQIQPPTALSEHWRGPGHTAFQGITLDYKRFMSDALLDGFVAEKAAIRGHVPHTPVTTNFMGLYQPIDYHRWASHLDFVSWDNYPPEDPSASRTAARMALAHGLVRGLRGGDPFWVMEQTPSVTACRDVNSVKRPGVLRLWSWQSVAHGADAVLYFQMRQARGACEKYHGAVLDHAGRTDTRVFREVAALGGEFHQVGDMLLGARTPARVALLVDWDSWWALEMSDGPNRNVGYINVLTAYHRTLWQANALVDVVPVTADLSGYDVVVAPLLHMVKGDFADRVTALVESGGSFVTTALSGRVDEDDNAFLVDVPGPFAALLGLRVEETDAQQPDVTNPVTLADGRVSDSRHVFEVIIPDEATEVHGTYSADFYAGTPAVTRARRGQGSAWYVGTLLDDDGVEAIIRTVLDEHDLTGPLADVRDVEAVERVSPDGTRYLFVLNHTGATRVTRSPVDGDDLLSGRDLSAGDELVLEPADVLVVRCR